MDYPDSIYDRTVTGEFLAHFLDGGFAASLVEYAHARYPMDLQMRKNPKTLKQWATLYVGMTAVVNIHDHGARGLALTAHDAYTGAGLGWSDDWSVPRPAEAWPAEWAKVEDYLERVIPHVIAQGRLVATEGLVQSAVSVFTGTHRRVVLDREVTPHFRDKVTKGRIRQELSDPLVRAVAAIPGVTGRPPTRFGMKCDILAVDDEGRLLAIEVKPGSVGSLAWVAAQATMYAKVLQHWIDQDQSNGPWRDVITKAFAQRQALGLAPPGFTLSDLRPEVVPAVAYQRIARPAYIDRMHAVQKALVESGAGDDRLKFYEVSLSGRLDETPRR